MSEAKDSFIFKDMPELPEVETIVMGLREKVLLRTFFDVWTDFPKIIKRPETFKKFKEKIKGRKIQNIRRRGKNILFELSGKKILLIHQKLTGHLLVGKWKLEKSEWKSKTYGPLSIDSKNKFLHLIFWLNGGQMIALSDLRKFAKVEIWDERELTESQVMKNLGPEPIEKKFTFEKFQETILKKRKGRIKQVLMDQTVIAGIGNIYSDEILWRAKINPLERVSKLNEKRLKKIYQEMRKTLLKAIEVGGESISDFRTVLGEKGGFDPWRRVYRKEGKKCFRCGAVIEKVKIGGRSAHFCPVCQALKN